MNSIGQRMKFIINQRNLNNSEVAKMLDTSTNNVYRYCNDIRTPSNEFLYQFSKELDVNFEWLMFGVNYGNLKLVYDMIPRKADFIQFLKTYQKENIDFLQGKTEYKEPMIMKSFRVGILKTSRKTMRKLMIQGYYELGLEI